MKYFKSSILFTTLLIFIMAVSVQGVEKYKPTRESLSQYQAPEWYQDAKIGFFYHWGPGSVSGDKFDYESMEFCRRHKYHTPPGQYGSHMYAMRSGEKDPLRILHEKWYGPAEEFGYKDLIPFLTGSKWDPEDIVELLDKAGVKYIVPMAIHHDGFAMWDSKVIDQFNAAKMGPKQNTTAQIIEEARKRGIKVGVSTHCARHYKYFPQAPEFDTWDSKYAQLYGNRRQENGLPRKEDIKKWENTLKELIDTFHPDYIFVDGGTADVYSMKKSYVINDAFRRIVAYYYNTAEKIGWEPAVSFKRESLYKEEAIPDYEGGYMKFTAPYKWQTHASLSGWFYRKGEKIIPSFRTFRKLIDVVSKNGNLLLNLAIKADGSIREDERSFLKDMEQWIKVVGEGIFATRSWLTYGELAPGEEFFFKEKKGRGVYEDPEKIPMGHVRIFDGDIRYTGTKDKSVIYAVRMGWPKEDFTLSSFGKNNVGKNVKIDTISLLGSNENIKWKRNDKGIAITPPSKPIFMDDKWPVMFKLKVK